MGLERVCRSMYIYKSTYIGAYFEHRDIKGKVKITGNGKEIPIQFNRISEIKEQVAYWRKANAIHAWFVNNVQEGVDECEETYIPEGKMQELVDICEQILKAKAHGKAAHALAQKLLPPQEGFFFGGTEIDEYYFGDLEDTVKQLTPLIKEEKEGSGAFSYRSSW